MEPTTKRRYKRDDPERYLDQPGDYPDMVSTVSATEATGMMPAPPQDEEEYLSYQELHGMQGTLGAAQTRQGAEPPAPRMDFL